MDEGRLEDDSDAAFALVQAARLAVLDDDIEHALRLAERAGEVEDDAEANDGLVESLRAELLFHHGRDDEAIAVLEAVRPALVVSADAVETIVDALRVGNQLALAEEWLTTAAGVVVPQVMRDLDENEEPDPGLQFLGFALLTERHDLRRELNLAYDDMDEVAAAFTEAFDDDLDDGELETGTVAFFPQGDLEGLIARWPDMAGVIGATWDDHRRMVELAFMGMSDIGATGLSAVPGSAATFISAMGEDEEDPGQAVVDYLAELEEPKIAWPPERDAACWCGSGAKYKKCCLPRSRR